MIGRKVAVVTGSNKGIGFAIVRALCKKWDGDIFLTSRNRDLGLKAVEELERDGCKPKYHQLDVTQQDSIDKLRAFIEDSYGGLDILVNNAGIAYKMASTAPFDEQAGVTIATNYYGTLAVCRSLFPLLRSHARVVNISSLCSVSGLKRCREDKRQRILAATAMADVDSIMEDFTRSAKEGTIQEEGWPEMAYGMSKVGVTAMTIIQQREMDKDTSREDVVINCCCPGYVATDMSSYKGPKTIDEGADTPVYLAVLPAGEKDIRGKYVTERKVKEWK